MKFSVIVPSFNGLAYLKDCIGSILSQASTQFELIVSDDHSTDGSRDYISSLRDARVAFVTPPHPMSMTEHWEWALSQARGEWLIFVGQDDGLMPYFFELADHLVAQAEARSLEAIVSRRAYYFWPGCASIYGDWAVRYQACPEIQIVGTRQAVLRTLLGRQSYFDLPTMYTTSLFRRSLLDRARARQGGLVFQTHPQDANLAAVAVSLTKHFLYSGIPLGWVGSSPKSAGMAIAKPETLEQQALSQQYTEKIQKSPLRTSPRIGNFRFDDLTLYFWGALLETPRLRGRLVQRFLASSWMTALVLFTVAQSDKSRASDPASPRGRQFQEILLVNQTNPSRVLRQGGRATRWMRVVLDWRLPIDDLLFRFRRKLGLVRELPSVELEQTWSHSPQTSLEQAGGLIGVQVRDKKLIERMSLR